jgi:phage-related protein
MLSPPSELFLLVARAAYVTATGRRVVVVHVFAKKTQKTPRHEIEIALKRAKEVK